MIAVARRNKIKEYIRFSKYVTVSELAAEFGVTEETIRRDLQILENENVLTRSYGGAYVVEGVENDINVAMRQYVHVEGKQRIAACCSKLVQNGDTLFLDASTTSLYVAQSLKDRNLSIVTNSAKILNELSESATIKLILIGGRLDRNSMSFIGPSAIRAMNQYHFDMAIVSCRSLALSGGIMDSNEQQAEIRSLALSLASQTILVADYTKLDRTAFCQIAPLTSINTLVVDAPLSSEWKDYLSKYDIAYEECISNVDDSVTENGG